MVFSCSRCRSHAAWTEACQPKTANDLKDRIDINVILTCSFQALRPWMVFPRSWIKTKEEIPDEKLRHMIVLRHSSQTEMAFPREKEEVRFIALLNIPRCESTVAFLKASL